MKNITGLLKQQVAYRDMVQRMEDQRVKHIENQPLPVSQIISHNKNYSLFVNRIFFPVISEAFGLHSEIMLITILNIQK